MTEMPEPPCQSNGRLTRFIKDVGFPVAVAVILLIDRITVFQKFSDTMAEVATVLKDVRHELRERGR